MKFSLWLKFCAIRPLKTNNKMSQRSDFKKNLLHCRKRYYTNDNALPFTTVMLMKWHL